MKFIKLTLLITEETIYVNMYYGIDIMKRTLGEGTEINIIGGEGYLVKETPEEILKLL